MDAGGSSWNSKLAIIGCKGWGGGGHGQSVLQIIRLNTLVGVIRVPKARTSGK